MKFAFGQKKYKNWGPGFYIKTALVAWGRCMLYGNFLIVYII